MSPEREIALGRQASVQVEREIGLVRDPKLTRYVGEIGERLAAASPRQDVTYHFAVADMAEANAFALPGGWVYVSRGLLALANSEDELANVIGHEIGHVAARHAAQRETRSTGVGLLSALGSIAAAVVGGPQAAQMVGQLGHVAGAGLIASYSRDQERQADVVGQDIAAEAGWDPAGMAGFLATLEREGRLEARGAGRAPSFLDSHPAAGERALAAGRRAEQMGAHRSAPIARSRADFLHRIEGVRIGPDPREGVFEDTRFLHPELDFAIDFPRGWQTQNSREAVGAMAPRQDAVVVLESQGGREQPATAARRWLASNPDTRVVDGGSLQLGPWPAYRALVEAPTQRGLAVLSLTWVAHPSGTFRLTGMTAPPAWRYYAPVFDAVARSLRPLSSAERSGIRGLRLAIAEARGGETLAQLGRRTGNRWSLDETAVANDLPRDARLESGRLVKIALATPLD
ncbi:MAG: M48 family metalloprotease [Deltaproteobacteria bacterium]|nr:M48 family metalloprotease [Deltaproteobacteria bacterium]